MKELSIEKKAKRYDKAIERAEGLIDFCSDSELKTLEYVFPELKESKDEKIRKVIYSWIYTQPSQFFDSGFSKEEMLAWLEKQGEQKPVIEMKSAEESLGIDSNTYNKIVDECIYGEQKPADKSEPKDYSSIDPHFFKTTDKVEPKFKVGDIISDGISEVKIISIDKNNYNVTNDEIENDAHVCNWVVYFKNQDKWKLVEQDSVCSEEKPAYKVEPKFKVGDYIEPIDSCLGSPLTIYKICDGFYKTNQGTLDFEFENNWRLIEQKSAWSEDDEVKINRIVACLENLNVADNDILLKDVDWLKSLIHQSQWKPSESQLEALDDFIYAKYPNIEKYEASVKSLYQDLKKLKE